MQALKRTGKAAVGAALVMVASTGALHAQTSLTLGTGAGVSFPIGDLSDFYGTGWHAQANVGVRNVDWPLGFRFDIAYHSLSGDDVVGGVVEVPSLNIIAGIANAELYVMRNLSGGGLFVSGGGGLYNIDSDAEAAEGVTKFGLVGGAGYKIAMTNLMLSIEGKFHHIFTESDESGAQPGLLSSSSQMIPISIVAEIPIGGR